MKGLIAVIGVLAAGAGCARHVAVTPAIPTVWERQVRNARDAGDGDLPLRTLRERVAAEPENVAVRLELAAAYQDRGFPEVALEIRRLAVARFPDAAEAQLSLVRTLHELKRGADAIVGLEAFLAAHPRKSPELTAWAGLLRDENGQWELGEAAHRKAVEIDPSAGYLHNNLGYNLLMQKKTAAAAEEFREALRLDPSSQLARNNLGLALAGQNANGEALRNWQSGAEPATAHNNLAAVWIEKGDYAEARKELGIALGYNKSHSAALRNLELLSRLDGKPAAEVAGTAGRWARWRAGIKRLFVGPLEGTGEPK